MLEARDEIAALALTINDTKGDPTRSITVETQGEVLALKDNAEEWLMGQCVLKKKCILLLLSKDREVEQTRQTRQERAEQLALTSRHKSQFLANMSHELRTPLNSLLLLARQLADNLDKNLTGKQIEYAQIICGAGNDLLALINDILDLSKIEAGGMTIEIQPIVLSSLKDHLERNFGQLAQSKNLGFTIELAPDLPQTISTDAKRLQQVLRNLLSNAFKFTEKGSITVRVASARDAPPESLRAAGGLVAFTVTDTGIGIPAEKQAIIFETFQQVDGGTGRKYGGTGLGLTISREISHLLGGEIRVHSAPGRGSTFTLYLPAVSPVVKPAPKWRSAGDETAAPALDAEQTPAPRALAQTDVRDDRDAISPGDMVLLIVEDDPVFARLVLDFAREVGFKGVVAREGDGGLSVVRMVRPQAALLDLHLPDMSGWMVLDGIKHDPALRHIPVTIVSGSPDETLRALKMGAIGFVEKPATREVLLASLSKLATFVRTPAKSLLVVEGDGARRRSIVELIGNGDVRTTAVKTGSEALARLAAETFDCAVLGAGLPDLDSLADRFATEPRLSRLPLVIYANRELGPDEEKRLRHAARGSVAKLVSTPEHLYNETGLFLHRSAALLTDDKKELLTKARQSDPVLAGRRVLVVDDDARNLFSITAVLERHHMRVINADNGRKGIETLMKTPDIDVVLMDVMMPEMNGYEAMTEIRRNEAFRSLPIISLTAKAMKGDREKCISAGASDYIPKPVDVEQLLAVLRVWLA